MTSQTDESDVLDLTTQPGYTANERDQIVFVAYTGREGFQISEPPEDPLSNSISEFGVPDEYATQLQNGLVANIDRKHVGGTGNKRAMLWSANNIGERAIQKSDGRSGRALVFENNFLPAVRFKPMHLTAIPRWLAEGLTHSNVRGLFIRVVPGEIYENWPIVGSTDGADYVPKARAARKNASKKTATKTAAPKQTARQKREAEAQEKADEQAADAADETGETDLTGEAAGNPPTAANVMDGGDD